MIRLLKMDYTTRALKHSQDHFMVQKLHSALAKANTGLKKNFSLVGQDKSNFFPGK